MSIYEEMVSKEYNDYFGKMKAKMLRIKQYFSEQVRGFLHLISETVVMLFIVSIIMWVGEKSELYE